MIRNTIRRAAYHTSPFKEGDICLLRQVNRPDRKWLSKPLAADSVQSTHRGDIKHADIIGAHPRSKTVESSGGKLRFTITRPTLEEFVEMCDRAAQPIYSQDAANIVYLADLHLDYPELDQDGKITDKKQFLEAGTGHGSLTMAICKAIHSANCFAQKDASLRGAVLHTIDNREQHSRRGEKNVELFNNGMYKNDVDFHVAEGPSQWIEQQSGYHGTEFLSGVFLDMPEPENHIPVIAKHMKTNSPIVVFAPSVTQILKVMKDVNAQKSELRLTFVKCVELATGGLKEWDLRSAIVRATGETADVARPKVGVRVVGGGFVGVFRKYGSELESSSEAASVPDSEESKPGLQESEAAITMTA